MKQNEAEIQLKLLLAMFLPGFSLYSFPSTESDSPHALIPLAFKSEMTFKACIQL
jgi:hypothetical protein